MSQDTLSLDCERIKISIDINPTSEIIRVLSTMIGTAMLVIGLL